MSMRDKKGRFVKGYKHTEEWKKQNSERMKGREITWGHKTSKTLMGHPGLKGKDNPMYGKHLVAWNKGIPHSEETKRKISEAHKGAKSIRWRGGISFEPYGLDWTETLRKAIRQRDNYTCQLCDKKQKRPRLHVHHIDYDKTNNDPDNLTSLCLSCHSKTNINRKMWRRIFNSNAKINIRRISQ